MKKYLKKIVIVPVIGLVIILALILLIDKVAFPWYVSAPEYDVPNVVGLNKDEAIKVLTELNLNPILQGPRYDARYPKDHVIFQKPSSGVMVKEGRRIYLFVSGGESLIKMPLLFGKTFRDTKVTIERLGLILGEVEEVKSEMPAGRIIEQHPLEGVDIPKGTAVDLKVSYGPKIGMIRIPNLLGKSFREAETLLKRNSLRIGKTTFLTSPSLLPNTIIDQYPGENKLVAVGDSVDVVITK
ncbi:MAG: PASTA domain-containing protein [Bacteroidetes bacterium]|nr:PASTA domain-containing protein [Bacteroidota bacterium]